MLFLFLIKFIIILCIFLSTESLLLCEIIYPYLHQYKVETLFSLLEGSCTVFTHGLINQRTARDRIFLCYGLNILDT